VRLSDGRVLNKKKKSSNKTSLIITITIKHRINSNILSMKKLKEKMIITRSVVLYCIVFRPLHCPFWRHHYAHIFVHFVYYIILQMCAHHDSGDVAHTRRHRQNILTLSRPSRYISIIFRCSIFFSPSIDFFFFFLRTSRVLLLLLLLFRTGVCVCV
jgi:hypothetical protein